MRWPFLEYTDNLPDGVAGDARGPFIRIRKRYEADEGLYQHQVRHVMQWAGVGVLVGGVCAAIGWLIAPIGILSNVQVAVLMGLAGALPTHIVLYVFVRRYRLASEIGAYRTQMRYHYRTGQYMSLDEAAERLANPRYRLGVTIDEARELLDR